MALLGIALPAVRGSQIALDVCPEPITRRATRTLGASKYDQFIIVRLNRLEQRYLWEAFQRVVRMSDADCWDLRVREELLNLRYDDITPPRNHFLYQAHFWPLDDLLSDLAPSNLTALFGTDLDVDADGFLLRLSFCVYRLFEQLMADLGVYSTVIKEQLDGSRFLSDTQIAELDCYRDFLSQVSVRPGDE